MRREKLRRTEAAPDAIADLIHADTAKALVMTYVGQLVADGYAEWDMLENEMFNSVAARARFSFLPKR